VSSRSGEIIEPLLSLQWFMAMGSLAKPALDAYRNGEVRFVPSVRPHLRARAREPARLEHFAASMVGHQLPVWYTPDGDAIVAHNAEEAREEGREKYARSNCAAIRIRSTRGFRADCGRSRSWLAGPDEELEAWYPNQVMITGREIIFCGSRA